MKYTFFMLVNVIILSFFISACGPSKEEMTATSVAETIAAASPTPTITPTYTPTFTPTPTPTPTVTSTPTPTFTPTPTPLPKAGDMQVSPVDGMVMMYIPAGEFEMGSGTSEGEANEFPMHPVHLDAFWMDQTEVTNAMFALYIHATNYVTVAEDKYFGGGYVFVNNDWKMLKGANWRHPQGPDSNIDGLDNYPVVHVSWQEAVDYCTWAGRRLPTEAEWEFAARGTDGRIYPWGNQHPNANLSNFADVNFTSDWSDLRTDDGYQFTAPVGSYPAGASPFGILDMAGNVAEWMADFYDEQYYEYAPLVNPSGPSSGEYGVLRGGSFVDEYYFQRSSSKFFCKQSKMYFDTGFRCAQTP